jgi:hypothetical protein
MNKPPDPVLHPETCAHCASVVTLLQLTMREKLPPQEVIQRALFLGLVVGAHADTSSPCCENCKRRLAIVKNTVLPQNS